MAYESSPLSDAYEHVIVEWVALRVVEVRMNRPKKRNAFDTRMWHEIGDIFSELLPREENCRCVLLTGTGKIFSAGIDLKYGVAYGIEEIEWARSTSDKLLEDMKNLEEMHRATVVKFIDIVRKRFG